MDVGSLIGHTLAGRYVVKKQLGKGGMAVVYLANDKSFGREIAVKVLRTDVAKDPVAAKRLIREARAAGQLHHPNIITMHDVGESDGLVYIVMEVLKGRELSDLMEMEGQINVERSLDISRQVASALSVAHANGIIHRDIKPENLFLIERNGVPSFVKMLDFSIAKLPTNMVTAALTRAGSVFGTPHYMAPEQVEGRQVCAQTDLYALGAVMYELIAGEPPFDGNSVIDILLQHAKARPPRLADCGVDVPPGLSELVDSMLAKKETDRPASASAVEKALSRMLADTQKASAAPAPPKVVEEPEAAPTVAMSRELIERELARRPRPTHPPPDFGPPGAMGKPAPTPAVESPAPTTKSKSAPPPAAKMAGAGVQATAASSPAPALDLPDAPSDLPAGPPEKMRAPFGNKTGADAATLIGSGMAAKVRAEAERVERERARKGGKAGQSGRRPPSRKRPKGERRPPSRPSARAASPAGPSSVVVNVPSPPPGRAAMPSVRAPGAVARPGSSPRVPKVEPPTAPMPHVAEDPVEAERRARAEQATLAVSADQMQALRAAHHAGNAPGPAKAATAPKAARPQPAAAPAQQPADQGQKKMLIAAIAIAAVGLLGLAAAAWLVLFKG